MKPLWLYLHFPHLHLDTLFKNAGSKTEAEQPLVILHGKQNQIVQFNQAAANLGINSNMGLGTAAALSQELQVIPYQYELEEKKLQEIAEHLYLVTSDISFFSPNGLLLRIHNMLSLYGGLQAYWILLKKQLHYFNISYHYATGQSPFAARMFARTARDMITEDSQQLQKALLQCQLTDSELPEKTILTLRRVGIHQLSDLLALSLKDIAKRFDIDLVTYLGRLTGEFHHPMTYFHPKSTFHQYIELLYEISHTDTLIRPIHQLLNALEHFLKVRDLLTQKIVFKFIQRDTDPLELEVGSAQGEYQAKKWSALTQLRLENLSLEAPVYGINLTTGETSIRAPEKADLFSNSQGALSYLQLISLLQAKLGQSAVKQPMLIDDFRPEIANIFHTANQQSTFSASYLQALRPAFLLPSPQPLREKAAIVNGPERISTGWWDNQLITRDYFIAHTYQGQWLWLFKTTEGKWFVHGVFS